MRLLYTANDGTLKWTKDVVRSEEIPPYAILSHTWKDGQEVTFDDLKNLNHVEGSDARTKEGYEKIRFCANQAKQDGLEYFWVDTCCIDKTNSAELQEAINSMFRWYQNAKKCYVLLSDLKVSSLEGDGEPLFRQSRWFRRGWTLQELLAPSSVEFFSKDGTRLGDKETFKQIVHEVTKIPIRALSGSNMSEFSVAERFAWTKNRETTREEDRAYCLFGIFGIHLPLIYGEGEENALERLRHAAVLKHDGRSHDQEKRLHTICNWLSAPDPSVNYHKALKQRQAETGLWLLESEKFVDWKMKATSRLWLYGIPGCGKTILSSTIVENLLEDCRDNISMVAAYFYFDFNDTKKQDPELMLRSLLCQFLQRLVRIPKYVDSLFSSCGKGQQEPSLQAILEVMPQVMQQFADIYVVLDALDECTQRPELMGLLETIAGWQLGNLHLLMTSRRERDIERSLEEYIEEDYSICLQRDVIDRDIERYVQQRLHDDKGLAKWNQDAAIRQEIETALMCGARGMFRWAVCQLDTLEKCRNRAMLRKALATLPKTLDQTYDRILLAISDDDCEYARRILQWLTFSERPLYIGEIAEVVAIDIARDPPFDRDEVLEDPLEALNICSSLVTITQERVELETDWFDWRTLTLAHYSVQEYLMSDRIKQGPAKQYSMQDFKCHSAITEACLKYILQLPQPLPTDIPEPYALARYSAQFWARHLLKTGDDMERLSQIAMSLMDANKPAYANWLQLYNSSLADIRQRFRKRWPDNPPPLYYAALFGLRMVTRMMLDRGDDVNAESIFGSVLAAAIYAEDEQIVRMLLENGAYVNSRGIQGTSALQIASRHVQENIVMLLLDKGADINGQNDTDGNTALHAAASYGHEKVVELLLDSGADINAQDEDGETALHAALLRGHKRIVKLLLNSGADTNVYNSYGNTVLHVAIRGGNEKIVKLLLDSSADTNAQDRYGNTALASAAKLGHGKLMKLLLDSGAEFDVQDGKWGHILANAMKLRRHQIAEILLDAGARPFNNETLDDLVQYGYTQDDSMEDGSWRYSPAEGGFVEESE